MPRPAPVDPAPVEPPRRGFSRHATALAAVAAVAGGLFWLLTRDRGPSPESLHRRALELLDDTENEAAGRKAEVLAERLHAEGFRDREFPGGVEFILGIVAFREAVADSIAGEDVWRSVAERLREAERQAVPADRRPQWAFALGISLYHLGRSWEARPLLEEALQTWPPGRSDAALTLVEMAVQQRRPEELQTALQRADELLTRSDVDAHVLEGAYRARTLVLLALDRADEAAQTLDRRATDERLGGGLAPSDGLALLRARVLMSRHTSETYQQAIELLEPLTRREGLERRFVGQASYLVAQCHEQLGRLAAQDGHSETASGHFDAAINRYARTADGQPDSDDGLASWVRSAALLREAGREEEALSAYRQAFARIEQPEEFHSLWLTLADLEQEALRARADWIERKRFDEAIALTEALAGLLGRLKASELVAEASTRRAQWLEEELQTLPPPERAARQDDVRQAWQTGGAAWADYAAQIATTSEYGEALWTSADHFDRGHNFERARQQLAAFLATNPQRRLAPATVRMGRLLLDLDRPEEAFFWFRQAIEQHPSDVAAIEAEYLLGRCHIEREDFKAAQQTWQNVLESENLTPDAREWRLSLFSLGRLQYSRAVLDERAAASAPPDERETFEESAHKRREECTRLLDEFAARYPADERAFEARYLAARARTLQSHGPRDRLDAAETEAARRRLENERRALLEAALAQYLSLERDLDGRDTDRGLGPLDERLLRGCWFHAAEALYELGRYDEAIERYAAAADRFPHDPGVLTAYLRISQCHERQGRFAEARSLLEQTRVIHEGLPDSAFDSSITSLTRSDWKDWIEWSREFAPQP